MIYFCLFIYLELFFWHWFLTHLMPRLVPDLTLFAPTDAATLALPKPTEAAAFMFAILLLLFFPFISLFSWYCSLLSPIPPEPHWSAQLGASDPIFANIITDWIIIKSSYVIIDLYPLKKNKSFHKIFTE